MSYFTENLDLESMKKINWVTKEASKRLPSSQVRLSTPRLSGKIPGESHAKNPYGANKMRVKEVCGPAPIKPLTSKLAALQAMTYNPNNANVKFLQAQHGDNWKNQLAMRKGISPDKITEIGATKMASDYYRRNRARILARNRAYRQKNKAMIAMKAKRYRMRVRSGAVRQRKRIHSGMGYTYAGY